MELFVHFLTRLFQIINQLPVVLQFFTQDFRVCYITNVSNKDIIK